MLAFSPNPPAVLDRAPGWFFQNVSRDLRPGNVERDYWQSWQAQVSTYAFCCAAEEYDHDICWGWTILRTSYDDDEKFNRAVSAIHRLALVRLEDEYRQSRTIGQPDNDHMDAVDRKLNKFQGNPSLRERVQEAWQTMAGRAKETMPPGEPFNPDWVITHELALRYHNLIVQDSKALEGADVSQAWQYAHALELEEREQGARGEFFIYLDQESIDLLAYAPSQEELARMEPADRSKTAWDYWVKAVSRM
ncbi:hypothetical protein K4F52_009405 [Lecanicillium sp. MT-2017a]|nr:hypothetical protein K4F52_009405 [Lecanicillium sp. MT-2017a]